MENKTKNMKGRIMFVSFVILFLGIILLLNVDASYCREQIAHEIACIMMVQIIPPLNMTFLECAVDEECIVHVFRDNRSIKNASVVVSGAINIKGYTDDNGKFKFYPDRAGNIKITAEKEGYRKVEGNFYIKKSKINIKIPDDIEVNREIIISIRNLKGKGIKTNITIVMPDGTTINVETDKDGHAKFTPKIPGKYKINVDENYEGEKEFIVYGRLRIIAPDTVKFMDKFRVNVVDENNNKIDAKIKILELDKEIKSGEEVIAEKCGNLNLVAEKEYYKKATKKIVVKNKKLNLMGKTELNAKEVYRYIVNDEDGKPVENVRILVNGTFVGMTDTNGTVSVKIENAGNYIIYAKKECYDDSSLSVKVTEFPWLLFLLLFLLLLLLLLLVLWYKKSKETEVAPAAEVITPFGAITKSVKIVKREGLETLGASRYQTVYVYLIPEKDMKDCKIVDTIPTTFDVNVLTLGVERDENKLTLNLGDINRGDVRILNYIVNGVCNMESAKIVYDGGKFDIPIIYV